MSTDPSSGAPTGFTWPPLPPLTAGLQALAFAGVPNVPPSMQQLDIRDPHGNLVWRLYLNDPGATSAALPALPPGVASPFTGGPYSYELQEASQGNEGALSFSLVDLKR